MNDESQEQPTDGNEEGHVRVRSRVLNGGLDPAEMGRRSGYARREKAARRAEDAEHNALTFRQRLGVSLSKLTQRDLDERVRTARSAELVRFADQAFGRPKEAEEDVAQDDILEGLTREQRAVVRQMLLDNEVGIGEPTTSEDSPD
jgi:hypothetical protein